MHAHFGQLTRKYIGAKILSQNIGQLIRELHKSKTDDSVVNFFSDKIPINLHIFGFVMLDWIISNVNCCFIVTAEHNIFPAEAHQLKVA